MRTNLLEALSDNIRIDKDKCIFCGDCAERCIMDNIRLMVSPCRQSCPMNVNIQGFVQLIGRGMFDEARAEVAKHLPLPGTMARICSAPCEEGCHQAQVSGAENGVAINELKRFLFNDPAVLEQMPLPECEAPKGKRVAVIGSGPAGLTAAWDLRLKGYEVTVFEKNAVPGGMLTTAIPSYRLPAAVIESEIARLGRMGIEFVCGCEAGKDRTLDQIRESFDAVILAVGLPCDRKLELPGEDCANVQSALPFLSAVRAGSAPKLHGEVLVIGGGSVAVDAALCALRQGAGHVRMVSLEQEDQLPALKSDREDALAEHVEFVCGWGVKELKCENGAVSSVVLKKCVSVFDENGRFAPAYDEDSTIVLAADHVISAIGQARSEAFMQHVGVDGKTLRDVEPVTLHMGGSLFAAGDWVSGASSAVKAMALGRRAAVSVDLFLSGMPVDYARSAMGYDLDFDIDESTASGAPRQQVPVSHPAVPEGDFHEIRGCFSAEQAAAEAGRCFSCGGPYGKFRSCWFCLPCEVQCRQKALYVEIPYLMR